MSSSEFITIISGEDLASAQTTADMDLETLLAGAKLDLPLIRNQEIVDLGVIHNGRQFQAQPFLKRKIAELGINGGDVIYVMPMAQKRSQSGSRTSQPSAALERALPGKAKRVAELISQIKVGAKRAAPTDSQGSSSSIAGPSNEEQVYRKQMEVVFRNLHESETHREYLRGEMPEIFEAWETHKDSLDEFQKAAVKCREDMYRKQRLAMEDPTNVEAQQYIAELIRKTNVIESENYAKEFMPETLIQIHMLYIRIVVNQVPIVAFIDTGAQVSIMSVSCAERCNLMRLLDTRYRSEAIGVGGRQKFQGRLHACEVRVDDHHFACQFDVMQDRQIDLLIGLNVLRKHNCCIDLTKNVLRWGDGTESVFLSASEYLAATGQDSDVTEKIAKIVELGFEAEEASKELEASNGILDQAISNLMSRREGAKKEEDKGPEPMEQ